MDERQIIEKWTNEMIRSSQLAAIRRETETKTQKIKWSIHQTEEKTRKIGKHPRNWGSAQETRRASV